MKDVFIIKITNGEHIYSRIKETRLFACFGREKANNYIQFLNKQTDCDYKKQYSYDNFKVNNNMIFKNKIYTIIKKEYLRAPSCKIAKAIAGYPTKKQAKQQLKFLQKTTRQTTSLFQRILNQSDTYFIKVFEIKE